MAILVVVCIDVYVYSKNVNVYVYSKNVNVYVYSKNVYTCVTRNCVTDKMFMCTVSFRDQHPFILKQNATVISVRHLSQKYFVSQSSLDRVTLSAPAKISFFSSLSEAVFPGYTWG